MNPTNAILITSTPYIYCIYSARLALQNLLQNPSCYVTCQTTDIDDAAGNAVASQLTCTWDSGTPNRISDYGLAETIWETCSRLTHITVERITFTPKVTSTWESRPADLIKFADEQKAELDRAEAKRAADEAREQREAQNETPAEPIINQ
jgi:hypothetical protein